MFAASLANNYTGLPLPYVYGTCYGGPFAVMVEPVLGRGWPSVLCPLIVLVASSIYFVRPGIMLMVYEPCAGAVLVSVVLGGVLGALLFMVKHGGSEDGVSD